MKIFMSIVVAGVLLLIFIFSYKMNKRIPKPKGCEDLEEVSESCIDCSNPLCRNRIEKKEDK